LQILGGIGCLGFACFLGFVLYQHFNGAEDWQLRRPGKAIGTIIFLTITGFGLIGSGMASLSSD
jgi:hypothetical protein